MHIKLKLKLKIELKLIQNKLIKKNLLNIKLKI